MKGPVVKRGRKKCSRYDVCIDVCIAIHSTKLLLAVVVVVVVVGAPPSKVTNAHELEFTS